jgi:ABC-type transport system involved in cytochrome c biogenesis permease subunit
MPATVNVIPLVLYLLAGVAYAGHFATRRPNLGRAASAILGCGALAHTFIIGMQTMQRGHVPLGSATAAISTFVWLLALAYLYTEMASEERAMGVFIVPLLVLLQLLPVFAPLPERRAAVLDSPWFGIHVSSLIFAYASFGLACVIGVTYVLLFKEIKAKHLGFFYDRLPSLQTLDTMNARAVAIGWAFLTFGVIIGVIWVIQARSDAASDPRLQAMTIFDPKIFVAFVSWAIYSFELWARRIGWNGRRGAVLSAVGFVIVLLNFVPVSYFLTRSHNF